MSIDRRTQYGLIQHLIAEPDDEAVRLVYADWLEDQGDPLAELVRVQVEIANAGYHRADLRTRERSLLGNLGFGRPAHSGRSYLGDNAATDWNHTVKYGLVALYLHESPHVVPAGWPERFGWYGICCQHYADFAPRSPLDTDRLRALLESPLMAGCYALDLAQFGLTTAAVRLLAESPVVANLLRLTLRDNRLDGDAVAALVESPHLRGLLELDLSQNALGASGLRALTRADVLPQLRRLRLLHVRGTPVAFARLGDLSAFPELRTLDLSWNSLDEESARAIAAAPGWPQLRQLRLRGGSLDDRRATALAAGAGLPQLDTLDVGENANLTDAGVVALITAPALGGLWRLDFSGCPAGLPALEALCTTGHLLRTGTLHVGWGNLTDAACTLLAQTPAAATLRILSLRNNAITDAGACALAASPYLQHLESLELAMCQIHAEGAAALTADGVFPRLRWLDLEYNPLEDAGALALLRWCQAHGAREVLLTDARLTSNGMLQLVASGYLRGLSWLGLSNNDEIGDAGVAALAACPDLTDLRKLDLCEIGMTDAGAAALLASAHLAHGLELTLYGQEFSAEIKAALQERFAKVWID